MATVTIDPSKTEAPRPEDPPILVPEGFSLYTENNAHILISSKDEAFLNPVQEFNRDLSVACIRVWSEELDREKEEKFRKAEERRAKRLEQAVWERPKGERRCLRPSALYDVGVVQLRARAKHLRLTLGKLARPPWSLKRSMVSPNLVWYVDDRIDTLSNVSYNRPFSKVSPEQIRTPRGALGDWPTVHPLCKGNPPCEVCRGKRIGPLIL